MTSAPDPIREGWRNLLIEAAFAKDYKALYSIELRGAVASNPILDFLLPSLLIVKVASLVDEALSEYIARNHLTMSNHYQKVLNGRINFLKDTGHLKDAGTLHDLKEFRNELAHGSSSKATWQDLETAIETASQELQHLGFVGPRPQFKMLAERVPIEPVEPRYVMSFRHTVTLKSGDKKVAEYSWTRHVLRDDE